MIASTQQIRDLYEIEGLSPEEITEVFPGEYELESVKTLLMSSSSLYREKAKENKELFSDSDMDDATLVIRRLMDSDDDNVALRSAIFTINEKKGRNDACLKSLSKTPININIFNAQLRRSREIVNTNRAPAPKIVELQDVNE